jgi:O-antigen ligase
LAIAITLTRAAIGALLVLLVVWAVQRQRSSGTVALRLRVFGLIAVTAAVAVPVIGAATIASRLSDANPTTAGSNFAQGRAVIWSQEFHLIGTSSPLALFLGHGAHAAYVSIETPLGFVPDSPHNIFLWGIVEIGLAGTALYVAFLVSSIGLYARFARIERYRFKGQVAAVGIAMSIAYLVQDQFTLSVSSPGHRWYFMLFLGATLSVLVRSDAEKPATALDVDSPNDANSRSGARISLAPTGRA